MANVAYALRAEFQGPDYLGGLIVAGDRDLNVLEELEKGKGQIVVSETDTGAVIALDEYPALKRVAPGDNAGEATSSRYDAMSVTDLRAELRLRDLDTTGVKADLAARLVMADALVADGQDPSNAEQDPPANPSQED